MPEEAVDAEGGDDGPEGEPGWFGVRCVFRWSASPTYEERITLWQADSLDDAIARAEDDAAALRRAARLRVPGDRPGLLDRPGAS